MVLALSSVPVLPSNPLSLLMPPLAETALVRLPHIRTADLAQSHPLYLHFPFRSMKQPKGHLPQHRILNAVYHHGGPSRHGWDGTGAIIKTPRAARIRSNRGRRNY